jgi:NADPH-dependent curcumin reductase CurA
VAEYLLLLLLLLLLPFAGSVLLQIVGKQIRLQGFIVSSLAPKYGADFAKDMAQYIKEGKVKVTEHLVEGGLGAAGQAFLDMMQGHNIGKAVVKVVAQDPYPVKA